MKTKANVFVVMLMVIASIIGDFCNNFAQAQTNVTVQKTKEIVFGFSSPSISNQIFSMELISDNDFLVSGPNSDPGTGFNSNYVASVNFAGVNWVNRVFAAANIFTSFWGDAVVYRASAESLIYATTENGIDVYNLSGGLVNSPVVMSGTKSKLVQRDSEKLMATKVVNSNAYLYNFTANGQLVDSIKIVSGVQDILSRYYEKSTKSWFFALRLAGINTALVKVTPTGVAWQKTYTNNNRTWVTADSNRVYIVSQYFTPDYKYRTTVKAYNQSGDLMWERNYVPTNTADSSSMSLSIALYPGGGCTIAGRSGVDASAYKGNFFTSFDINGSLLWEKIFSGDEGKSPFSIQWNSKRELIAGGKDYDNCYIAAYSVSGVTVGINDPEPSAVNSFILNQNYPNPFNPTTKISYYLPNSAQVQLVVYNSLGQQIAELVNGFETSGLHEVIFDGSGMSSGVYFTVLRSGTYVQTKKMVLMK